jgi:hypothetical protein
MEISENLRLAIRESVFTQGRLLERATYLVAFEGKPLSVLLRALRAYQNEDGGFGHGIEPDLLAPGSSAIGAETALTILDMLKSRDQGLLREVAAWVEGNLTSDGILPHPPQDLEHYPFQSWWSGDDRERVLAVAGLLHGQGVTLSAAAEAGIRTQALRTARPEKLEMYSYPLFVYALYTPDFPAAAGINGHFLRRLPGLLAEKAAHNPLFSRYWYHALPHVAPETVRREAEKFILSLQADGGVANPYPQLPWWRVIFTLDGLVLLRNHGLF